MSFSFFIMEQFYDHGLSFYPKPSKILVVTKNINDMYFILLGTGIYSDK